MLIISLKIIWHNFPTIPYLLLNIVVVILIKQNRKTENCSRFSVFYFFLTCFVVVLNIKHTQHLCFLFYFLSFFCCHYLSLRIFACDLFCLNLKFKLFVVEFKCCVCVCVCLSIYSCKIFNVEVFCVAAVWSSKDMYNFHNHIQICWGI